MTDEEMSLIIVVAAAFFFAGWFLCFFLARHYTNKIIGAYEEAIAAWEEEHQRVMDLIYGRHSQP